MEKTKMKAALQSQYGGPDILHETTVDLPITKPGELLIRIAAASVNGYDVLMRSGALKMTASRTFPKLTGLDFFGHVVTPAGTAPQFKVGDQVWGTMPLHLLGSVAEYVSVAPQQIAHTPAGLAPVDAAALPVVGVTALIALRDIGRLQPGQRLLIRGASGGVGSVAVQLGKALGAHVTGLASARNLEFVRGLGADQALDYATTSPDNLGRFDVILDTVGSSPAAWRRLLTPHGRMAAIVPDPKHPLKSLAYFYFSRIYGDRRVNYFNAKPDTTLLNDLAGFVTRGDVKAIVDGVYPMSRIADAHRAFETSKRPGKQIIQIGE